MSTSRLCLLAVFVCSLGLGLSSDKRTSAQEYRYYYHLGNEPTITGVWTEPPVNKTWEQNEEGSFVRTITNGYPVPVTVTFEPLRTCLDPEMTQPFEAFAVLESPPAEVQIPPGETTFRWRVKYVGAVPSTPTTIWTGAPWSSAIPAPSPVYVLNKEYSLPEVNDRLNECRTFLRELAARLLGVSPLEIDAEDLDAIAAGQLTTSQFSATQNLRRFRRERILLGCFKVLERRLLELRDELQTPDNWGRKMTAEEGIQLEGRLGGLYRHKGVAWLRTWADVTLYGDSPPKVVDQADPWAVQYIAALLTESGLFEKTFKGLNAKGKPNFDTYCNFYLNALAALAFNDTQFTTKTRPVGMSTDEMFKHIRGNVEWTMIRDPEIDRDTKKTLQENLSEAQSQANKGYLVIVGFPGHVATVMPGSLQKYKDWGLDLPWTAQAGLDVFSRRRLSAGFILADVQQKLRIYACRIRPESVILPPRQSSLDDNNKASRKRTAFVPQAKEHFPINARVTIARSVGKPSQNGSVHARQAGLVTPNQNPAQDSIHGETKSSEQTISAPQRERTFRSQSGKAQTPEGSSRVNENNAVPTTEGQRPVRDVTGSRAKPVAINLRKKWEEDLQSKNGDIRLQGIYAVAVNYPVSYSAIPYLTPLVNDPDADVRELAGIVVEALKELEGDPLSFSVVSLSPGAFLERLIEDLRHKDPSVRLHGIRVLSRLGEFGRKVAIPHLIAALDDPNADVRELAKASLEAMEGTIDGLGRIMIGFDDLNAARGPVNGPFLSKYLKVCGITIDAISPGTRLEVCDYRVLYEGKVVRPPSSPNLLTQVGSTEAAAFTMRFRRPLDKVAFSRSGLIAATPSGITHPEWSAIALNAQGEEIDRAGETVLASHADVASKQFTLKGPGITAIRWNSDAYNFAAFGGVLIDDLLMYPQEMEQQASAAPGRKEDYLTPAGQFKGRIAVKDTRGFFGAGTGWRCVIEPTGDWLREIPQNGKPLVTEGRLSKRQLTTLAEELSRYNLLELPEEVNEMTTADGIDVILEFAERRFAFHANQGFRDLPKPETATLPGRFAGVALAILKIVDEGSGKRAPDVDGPEPRKNLSSRQ